MVLNIFKFKFFNHMNLSFFYRRYTHIITIHIRKVLFYFMEYWSFYGSEGWYFVRHDLDENKDVFRGANIPWDAEIGIPRFLLSDLGRTKYNYMTG